MKHQNSGPSQRMLKVGEQIRHIIAETLQRGHFRNPLLIDGQTITVSEVRMSPDLKHARAYVSSLGGGDMSNLLPALNEEAQIFQKEIGRKANLKFTPRIKFVTDTSYDEAEHIENLLREVSKGSDGFPPPEG